MHGLEVNQFLTMYAYDKLSVLQDDDSDLEYELEAFPHVSTEASSEAAACVKVSE